MIRDIVVRVHGPLVDHAALADYLAAELGPADEYDIGRFRGRHSNETLLVTWNDQT